MFFSHTASEVSARFIPTDPICVAVDYIERHMIKKGFAISQGKIFKKAPDSQFTFVYCLTVNTFLKKLLGIAKVANKLASHISAVTNLLSDADCGLIKPIKILYNVIEVLPEGTIFLISEKKFYKIKQFPKGCTPRAFVRYTYQKDRTPYPRPFIQG